MSAEARIKELGLELPPAPKPAGVYQPVVVVGNITVEIEAIFELA